MHNELRAGVFIIVVLPLTFAFLERLVFNLVKRENACVIGGPEARVVDIARHVEVRVGEVLLVGGAHVMRVFRQCEYVCVSLFTCLVIIALFIGCHAPARFVYTIVREHPTAFWRRLGRICASQWRVDAVLLQGIWLQHGFTFTVAALLGVWCDISRVGLVTRCSSDRGCPRELSGEHRHHYQCTSLHLLDLRLILFYN